MATTARCGSGKGARSRISSRCMYRPDSADEGNLAALCLQCHDDTQIRGGFGRKLNAAQVIQYRDDWVKRIAEIRAARGRHIRLRLPSEDPRAPYKVIQGE